MYSRFLFLPLVLILGACAYTLDGQTQEVTIMTPGAEDSLCYVYVDDLKYTYHPPQTIRLFKSKEDLRIDCLAPGNRRKSLTVAPTLAKSAAGNILNGVIPGTAWDYTSGSMFEYPGLIEITFFDIPVRPEDLPAQNNPDIKQPEEYRLEEFNAAQPILNEDRNTPALAPLKKRERGTASSSTEYITEGSGPDKGDLQNVTVINPPADAPPAADVPVPLYPGQ
jgi:hypothetical protein